MHSTLFISHPTWNNTVIYQEAFSLKNKLVFKVSSFYQNIVFAHKSLNYFILMVSVKSKIIEMPSILKFNKRKRTKLSLNWGRSLKSVARDIKSLLEENVFESLGSCHSYSVFKLCPTLCNPAVCSTPGFSVLHCLLEFAQIHVHWVSNAIWLSHLLLPPFPFALNLSQHQGLFQWVGSLHQVAKVLELQLQHQSFQWILRVEILKVKKRN